MQRRDFISLLGGAVAWPLAAHAQQPERMRRIGMLINTAADYPEGKARVAVFLQTLQSLGWTSGRNVQIDIRWGAADAASARRYAAEMVALAPDVILTGASAATAAVQEATRTLPIVFVERKRPSRRWLCREPGATRRQRHRVYLCRIWHEREMAGVTQGDCPSRDASSGSS